MPSQARTVSPLAASTTISAAPRTNPGVSGTPAFHGVAQATWRPSDATRARKSDCSTPFGSCARTRRSSCATRSSCQLPAGSPVNSKLPSAATPASIRVPTQLQ